ncbi:Protein takeout [Blattella germanica]|nr:Protein takeout [Blattella germanica]
MDITSIIIQDGAGRPVNIKLNLTNIKAVGLTSGILSNFRADLDNRILETDATMQSATLSGKYDMDGKFLVLPMKGNGNCRMEFTGMKVALKLIAEPLMKKGKQYWNVLEFKVKVTHLDKLVVNFDNLFNGDKVLGDNTNKVLNENWGGFWEELRPTFEDSFGQIFLYLAKQCFGKVPENEIFLN